MPSWGATAAAGIIGLLVGAFVGWASRRRRARHGRMWSGLAGLAVAVPFVVAGRAQHSGTLMTVYIVGTAVSWLVVLNRPWPVTDPVPGEGRRGPATGEVAGPPSALISGSREQP